MTTPHEETRPLWGLNQVASAGKLPNAMNADVCVIGAGIAGLSVAYHLVMHGKSVIVVDDGPVGGGQTHRTTAHLTNAIDDRYFNIEAWHGAEGLRLAADSHTAAISRMEDIIGRHQIECGFERLDGYLFTPRGESADLLERERDAAQRAGVPGVELIPSCPLASLRAGPCLRFPRQGQFHPMQYLQGLVRVIQERGGQLITDQHVTKVEAGPPAHIETRNGPFITADNVVVATNSPFNDYVIMHTKQHAYTTYVLAFGAPRGAIPQALYWDTASPYHYVRKVPWDGMAGLGDEQTEDLIIVGGEDHKSGQANDAAERYDRLERWAREHLPLNPGRRRHWSGQVLETIDGLGFIGHNPMDGKNVYIATGDSGMGMTHGTIAGMLISDLILGRSNPWTSLYDPERKSLRAASRYLQENLNVASQYTAWVTGGDVSSVDEIRPGSGAVIRTGLSMIAAFRDDSGRLHQHSAVCPHLGCIVRWNQNEKTWDCPCHGSRFDCQGKLVIGPANVDLPPVNPS